MLAQAYENLGRVPDAVAASWVGLERAERALAAHPHSLPASLGAAALAWLGESARAREWASRALTIAPDDPLTQYNVACTYALLGELDKALDLLEQWVHRANAETKKWILTDSDLDNLRDHPRFQKLFAPEE